MAKKSLDALVGACYPDIAALRRAVEEAGGLIESMSHFELRAINGEGRRVCYRLAEGEAGIEVAERMYS